MRKTARVKALRRRRVLASPVLAGLAALLPAAGVMFLVLPVEAPTPRHARRAGDARGVKPWTRPSTLAALLLASSVAEATVEPAVAASASETTTQEPAPVVAVTPVPSGCFTYTEAWFRDGLLDPAVDTEGPRLTILGRVLRPGATDEPHGARGARVRLLAAFADAEPGGNVAPDDMKRVLGGVPAEQRSLFRRALSDDAKRRVLVCGETTTNVQGRFVFAVDPAHMPERVSFYASATLELDGARWAVASNDSVDLRTSDVNGPVERTFDPITVVRVRQLEVLVHSGGVPVAGALVAVDQTSDEDLSGTTDAQGRFVLELLGGSARISVSRPGLSARVRTVPSDVEGQLVFDVVPETTLTLRVVDATGASVEGASYSVSDKDGVVASGTTDERGSAAISGLAPGDAFTVEASGPDGGQGTGSTSIVTPLSSVTVALGVAAAITVRLTFNVDVPERVRASGQVSCHLERRSPDGTFLEVTTQNAGTDGVCTLGHLEGGVYQVYTTEEKLAPSFSGLIQLEAGAARTVSLDESYGHVVSGWVLDAQGSRQDAAIYLGGTHLKLGTSSGWLEVRVPSRGTTLSVVADHFAPVTVDAGPQKTHLGDIVLAPGASGD